MHISWFQEGVKGYKLLDPKNKKKVLSRDVVFDELNTQGLKQMMEQRKMTLSE